MADDLWDQAAKEFNPHAIAPSAPSPKEKKDDWKIWQQGQQLTPPAPQEQGSTLQRAAKNFLPSLINTIRGTSPIGGIGQPPAQPDGHGGYTRTSATPFADAANDVGNAAAKVSGFVGGMVTDPRATLREAFASNPVGTVAAPALGAAGLVKAMRGAPGEIASSGAKAAAPDVGMGAAKVGAGGLIAEGLHSAGPPLSYMGYAAGAAPAYQGARQIMQGMRKGFSAAGETYRNLPEGTFGIAERLRQAEPLQLEAGATRMPGPQDPSGPIPFTPPESWSNPPKGATSKPVTPSAKNVAPTAPVDRGPTILPQSEPTVSGEDIHFANKVAKDLRGKGFTPDQIRQITPEQWAAQGVEPNISSRIIQGLEPKATVRPEVRTLMQRLRDEMYPPQ